LIRGDSELRKAISAGFFKEPDDLVILENVVFVRA